MWPADLCLSRRQIQTTFKECFVLSPARNCSAGPPLTALELLVPLRVRAHDVRRIATSINLWSNKSVEAVLNAASWRTPSVFAKHYLDDVERSDGDTFSLGPIVAAGGIVTRVLS